MGDKVSVIVPIYNVEDYLKKCIESLLAQTYENIEIILVDDCSTDKSADIAKEYAEKYPKKCKFVQREKNGGLSAARNTGIDNAEGEWLTFVDSDDWVTDDYVASLYDVAMQDHADIVMSSVYYYYPKTGKVVENSPFGNLTTKSSQKEKVALSGPYATTRLYRKSFYDSTKLEFPTNVWRAAEQGITIPLLTRTDKISILRKPMYYYYQRIDSNSNNNHRNVDTSFMLKSVENVEKNSADGFEEEIEYRSIVDILYGMVMIMIRSGRSNRDIKQQVDWFNEKFPNWKENQYIPRLVWGKRVFISAADKKMCGLLRAMIWAWDIRNKLR